MSEACTRDNNYIEGLERELRNCSLEIGYLQDQLNQRNGESNCMGEHVRSLELKLAEVGTLHAKLRLLTEALMQSESRRLSLVHEIKNKENELQDYALQIKELETAVSSVALESTCEVESMKLDITSLEERCFEAERLSQQAAQEKAGMDLLLEMSESQFQDAHGRINNLEMENKDLKQQQLVYEANVNELYCKVVERLDTWLKHNRKMIDCGPGSFWDLLFEIKTELPSLKEKCTSEDLYCPFASNPAIVTALDENVKEMKKMTTQICELELQVGQLKEELRTEKLKAKEEAEDLTQEMAELRYQMTNLLDEECKRRASIEQTSLRRIQDLEEEVRKEQNKCLTATRRFQEAFRIAELRADEIRHLKTTLEGFRKIMEAETARKIESSCNHGDGSLSRYKHECSTRDSVDAEALDEPCNSHSSHQALIGWHSDGEAPSTEAEYKTSGMRRMQMQ